MALNIGDTVGDYRITGILGAGGMGTVFEVRHLISHRTEAMKVLLPDLEGSPELAERFLREIRLQASLSHPAIATLHTALRHDNQLLMVMEYVDGESLDVVLRRRGVTLPVAIDISLQLLSALGYAHGRGVIHRDIKPANIVLMPMGHVKLLDFGIARPLADPRLTRTGAAIGSIHYMSPEQLRGGPVDSRTDLYSTGITLYEMAAGERPFTGGDSYVVMKAHMEQEPRPPELLNPAIPPELSRNILRALKKNQDERFQSAEEFALALQRSREEMSATITMPRPGGSAYPFSTPTPYTIGSGPRSAPRTPPSGTPRSASSEPATILFEPEGLERATRALAQFIGPVAKVLVTRAAKKATSWDDLYHRLAAEVPAGKDRDRFLSARQR